MSTLAPSLFSISSFRAVAPLCCCCVGGVAGVAAVAVAAAGVAAAAAATAGADVISLQLLHSLR